MSPFDVLLDRSIENFTLPGELEAIYGRLGFEDHVLYANFVASLDGVSSLGSIPSAGSVISGRYEADRFLMGLLRACADAVVIGAGTLRATPGHQWTPDHVAPALAQQFADLRRGLGRESGPRLVVLSAGGAFDLDHVAIRRGATIVTTEKRAHELAGRLPASCDVIGIGTGPEVDIERAVGELRARGYRALLTEGGPHLMGELIRRDLVDEVFLTVSPVMAGRGESERMGIVAGAELLPANGVWSRLVSARAHGDFLFLRYQLAPKLGAAVSSKQQGR